MSLKKVKEDRQIVRTNSYRRIERPIPTTERSVEEGTEVYLTHLIEQKKKIEREINELNSDFDRYYEKYAGKLKELKELQLLMNEQYKQKIHQ